MNNRERKRALDNDTTSTSQVEAKRQKSQYSSPKKTGTAMKNIDMARDILAKAKNKLQTQDRSSTPTISLIQNISNIIDGKLDDKKITVGVFGKTGAGKSSLINAILGENDLLPSGTLRACTSVIIQVEANLTDSNYTAEIEFISKQDWEEELEALLNLLSLEDDEENNDAKDKIIALYGAQGLSMQFADLIKDEKFSKIPEFLRSETKKITCQNALDLSNKTECYIKHDDTNPGGCYWPLVKNVTIKVPTCKNFLKHIVLVDLPGTGDYNKSRGQMWRSKIRECSTVWIVSEINRAGSEKEAWEFFFNCIRDMAGGGQCNSISFICTKTDDIDPDKYMRTEKIKDADLKISPEDTQYRKKKQIACILHRNKQAKEMLKKNFEQKQSIKKHFSCDETFFSVYTVSPKEFFSKNPALKPEETEIPVLRELLEKFNNSHTKEVASDCVSRAISILFQVQGCMNDISTDKLTEFTKDLKTNLDEALKHVYEYNRQVHKDLEELLSKGVKESKAQCIKSAKTAIYPKNRSGSGFHKTLEALCKNGGFCRSSNGYKDLNLCLAKHMLKYVEKPFNDFFPNKEKGKDKSLQETVSSFTVITEKTLTKYRNSPELNSKLKGLETKENTLRSELKKSIVKEKQDVFNSLQDSIRTKMLESYKEASKFKGNGSMNKRQGTLIDHIKTSKHSMFDEAMRHMLELLDNMMNSTVNKLKSEILQLIEYPHSHLDILPSMDIHKLINNLESSLAELKGTSVSQLGTEAVDMPGPSFINNA